jgi:hypothetical protein
MAEVRREVGKKVSSILHFDMQRSTSCMRALSEVRSAVMSLRGLHVRLNVLRFCGSA